MGSENTYNFTKVDAENYDFYLGPVIFEPYAAYLAKQINISGLHSVLELASGTGRVTRHIRHVLPPEVKLWATDLSTDMLDIAQRKLGDDQIVYKTEDIQQLSFDDHTFDLVVCQFGMMFLPNKQKGFNEIYRVLKPGGKFICLTWDSSANNPLFGLLINELILPWFKDEDASRLFTPFSLHQPVQLEDWMKTAGFFKVSVESVALPSGSNSLDHLEIGFFRKHGLGKALFEKNELAFEAVAKQFRKKIVERWGKEQISFPMSALVTIGEK